MHSEPVTIENELLPVTQAAGENVSRIRHTVLLVEDETFVRNVTREVLLSAGYSVLTATNSAEAVENYETNGEQIDLLVTDVVLPDENGRNLAQKLLQRDSTLPVLFVTGYGEHMAVKEPSKEPSKERSKEASMECLPKPFSSVMLLQRIRQILDQRPLR